MGQTMNKEIAYLILVILLSVNCSNRNTEHNIEGMWFREMKSLKSDTMGTSSQGNVFTYMIYTDTGFVYHSYIRDILTEIRYAPEVSIKEFNLHSDSIGIMESYIMDTSEYGGIRSSWELDLKMNKNRKLIFLKTPMSDNWDQSDGIQYRFISNDSMIFGSDTLMRYKSPHNN